MGQPLHKLATSAKSAKTGGWAEGVSVRHNHQLEVASTKHLSLEEHKCNQIMLNVVDGTYGKTNFTICKLASDQEYCIETVQPAQRLQNIRVNRIRRAEDFADDVNRTIVRLNTVVVPRYETFSECLLRILTVRHSIANAALSIVLSWEKRLLLESSTSSPVRSATKKHMPQPYAPTLHNQIDHR
jgi:hypothetical protein